MIQLDNINEESAVGTGNCFDWATRLTPQRGGLVSQNIGLHCQNLQNFADLTSLNIVPLIYQHSQHQHTTIRDDTFDAAGAQEDYYHIRAMFKPFLALGFWEVHFVRLCENNEWWGKANAHATLLGLHEILPHDIGNLPMSYSPDDETVTFYIPKFIEFYVRVNVPPKDQPKAQKVKIRARDSEFADKARERREAAALKYQQKKALQNAVNSSGSNIAQIDLLKQAIESKH